MRYILRLLSSANPREVLFASGRVGVARLEPVFEDEGGNAVRVEPAGHLLAFVIDDMNRVSTTGTNDDTRAGRLEAWLQANGS